MGRFGGDLMRGLAGMLGGVSEGIDEQEKRKRLDAELELRRQAEARALAQDEWQRGQAEQTQRNWLSDKTRADLSQRMGMRDAG